MTRRFGLGLLLSGGVMWMLPVAASAALKFKIPDFEVHPGESGTFDALIEFSGAPPTFAGFPVGGYNVRIATNPSYAGFRIPSAADGLIFGAGIVSDGDDAIESENGLFCVDDFSGFGGCAIDYPPGSHLLLRVDYQVNPNALPGAQYALSFDPAQTHLSNGLGIPYASPVFDNGTVTVVANEMPILGGPIGSYDLPGGLMVEDFNLGVTSPVPVPLVVSNAVITTSTGTDLNYSTLGQDYTFGSAISQWNSSDSIIADFSADTLQAGAWVGGPSNKGITADFYAGDELLGSTIVHSVYRTPVFIGFESKSDYITRAVFSGIGTSTTFSLDRLTIAPVDFVVPGDFNGDGFVNAADYTVWRTGLGSEYTAEDYYVWKANFGQTAAGFAAVGVGAFSTVPEPASWILAASATVFVGAWRAKAERRRR